MDVKDVSTEAQYVQAVERQRATLKAAAKRRGELPRDRKPRAQTIHEHMQFFLSQKAMRGAGGHGSLMHSSILASSYLPSVAPFGDLKRILLKELRLEVHHRGYYSLLRVVTPSVSMTAVVATAEDETGDATSLSVYQQEGEDERAAQGIMCVNSVCIVKEPYFKVASDGNYFLRVDHISDISWLAEDDERIPKPWRVKTSELSKSADERRKAGNAAMGFGRYQEAVKNYSLALRRPTTAEEAQAIRLNRALALLKLGRYDDALRDATGVLAHQKRSEKGLYRAALALYQLGHFQDCLGQLETLLTEYPNNEAAKEQLGRAKERVREQEGGVYDFRTMYESVRSGLMRLDLATYSGPVVVKASDGRGRGLFATRPVNAGEFLLCEKAFAYCYAAGAKDNPAVSSAAPPSQLSLLMNLETNRITIGTHADLIKSIVHKLQRNPSLASAFTSLYHGSYEPATVTEVDGEPVVDTFLVDRIISFNSFGAPSTSFAHHFGKPDSATDKPGAGFDTSGIWSQASYINHSCYGNVRRSFIGDMLILRASQDIPAGTELTFAYLMGSGLQPEGLNKRLLEQWGFECRCAICTDARGTPKKSLKRRVGLMGDLQAAMRPANAGADQLSKVERLLKAIDQTYKSPAAEVPRLPLAEAHLHLARVYIGRDDQPEKLITSALSALGSLGFVIKGGTSLSEPSLVVEKWGLVEGMALEIWVRLAQAYLRGHALGLFEIAKEYARTSYRICIGEDTTFEETYGKVFNLADPYAYDRLLEDMAACTV